jgi:rhamnulokinase
MSPAGYVAIDLGAQSGRVLLGVFDSTGLKLQEISRFPNSPIEIDGVLCWDGAALFAAAMKGLAAVVARGVDVAGVAVDTWGVDYGLIGEGGELIAPLRHYRAATPDVMRDARALVSEREAYARTGIDESPINTCFQLIRDRELGLLDQACTMLLTPDLWSFWLTGETGAERTIASTTGMLDRATGGWALDLIERWGIPSTILPTLQPSGTFVGQTQPAITNQLRASIPVFRTGAHDTASAFAAVVDSTRPTAVISCGTWALAGCLSVNAVLTEEGQDLGFTNEEGVDGRLLVMRNLSGTWLLEECLRAWAADASIADVTALRNTLIHGVRTDAADFDDVIDPGDSTLLQPGDMPERIRTLYSQVTGRSLPNDPTHIVALILRSLAIAFAQAIHGAARLTDQDLQGVVIIGGGSQIEPLVELTQRAVGLPVRRGPVEATGLGSVLVQSVAAGQFDSLDDARDAAIIWGNT